MSQKLSAAVLAALVALLSHPAFREPALAQEGAAEVRVARLVRELGADSFAVRTQATEELAKLGPTARQAIEAATRSDDAEVRLRAKDLLQSLKVAELWSPARFTCPQSPTPATQILRILAEQTGNHVVIGDQFSSVSDQPVNFDFATADYWTALDEVCRQSGNHCRPHYDSRTPGVVVVAGAPGRQPLAYSGPVRGRIITARRVFNEELSYEDLRSDKTHTFQISLEMTWEDRFKLVAYRSQPDVLEAQTDAGAKLAAPQPTSGGWNVAGAGTRQITMNLQLSPPSANDHELDALRLSWGLIAVGEMAALEVEGFSARTPHFQDDVELVVESLQSTGGRCEVVVVVRRALNLPEPHEILLQEHDLELLGAEGKPLPKLGQNNTLVEHGARLKYTFAAEDDAAPAKLRLVYPRLRSQRDLEIVFRHVPLPVARPE